MPCTLPASLAAFSTRQLVRNTLNDKNLKFWGALQGHWNVPTSTKDAFKRYKPRYATPYVLR